MVMGPDLPVLILVTFSIYVILRTYFNLFLKRTVLTNIWIWHLHVYRMGNINCEIQEPDSPQGLQKKSGFV